MPAPTGPMSPLSKDLLGLNANPLFNVGMGLLSSRYDPSINPFNAVMQGINTSNAAADMQRKREQEEAERQRIENLRRTVSGFIGDSSAVGHPTLQDGPGAQFTPLQQELARAYGAAAQYGDPMQALTGYTGFLDDTGAAGGGGDMPSNIREWMIYNKMPEEDQRRYLEMKRGQQIKTVGGNIASIFGTFGPEDILSSLSQEAQARLLMKGAEGLGTKYAAKFDVLKSDSTNRRENYAEALRLLEMVKANDLPTGLYTGAVYKVIPTADQEALDSLSLMVARQKLTALEPGGRYTDADVKTLRDALFGSFRSEEFNRRSLERLIREIEALEAEYTAIGKILGQGTAHQLPAGQLPTPTETERVPGVMEVESGTEAPPGDTAEETLTDILRKVNQY